jgi:DDE family transposase
VSHQVIVDLIAATATKTGLKVTAQVDTNVYPVGTKISKKQMAQLQLLRDDFHGEWNYTIKPRPAFEPSNL